MPITDNVKQKALIEKGNKLNVLSTLVLVLGCILHVFTDYSLIALAIFFGGLWLYTWALHIAPLYTFFENDTRRWKRYRRFLLIGMSIATTLLVVVLLANTFLDKRPIH